ncbi:MAG: hypothetical protein AAF791_05460 [Bacteroidota bacterium]
MSTTIPLHPTPREVHGVGKACALVTVLWLIGRGVIYAFASVYALVTDEPPQFDLPLYGLMSWLPAWVWGLAMIGVGVYILVKYLTWRYDPRRHRGLSLALRGSGVFLATVAILMLFGNPLSAGWVAGFVFAATAFWGGFSVRA